MRHARFLASKLVIPLSVAHTAAYCIFMCESKTSHKLSDSNDEEMVYRFLILTGSATLAGFLEFLYQKAKQNNASAANNLLNDEAVALIAQNTTPENENNSCWDQVKQIGRDFHRGFSLSAGTLALSFAAFPAMGISGNRELEPLSMISTAGTVVGSAYAIKQKCKKKVDDENNNGAQPSQIVVAP